MKRAFFSLFLATLFLFLGCVHDPFPPNVVTIDNDTNNTDTIVINYIRPCDSDSVYFENYILPLLQSNCALSGCHDNNSAEKGVILTSYNNIIKTADVRPFDLNGSDLYERITDTDPEERMPPFPYSSLTANQINMIAKWINQGALNNGCDECDTLNVTFSNTIFPLIQVKCKGCHSGINPAAGISLTMHSEIEVVALNGSLYSVVNHESGYVPMPFNGNKLRPCELKQIQKWIDSGAPNN